MGLYSEKDSSREGDIVEPADHKPEPYRTPWRRDYARLIHSAAFRRLQGKTQLFPGLESDFFRNRLTHSLEVAQIAKSIAIKLNHDEFASTKIDTDLVEVAGLAHDLGHPPFGHNGEQALDDCMKAYGGFEGNAQTLRILAKLEKRTVRKRRFRDFSDNRLGLNLAYRTLASILKYDNQIPYRRKKSSDLKKGYYYTEAELVKRIKAHVAPRLGRQKFKVIECQIMDLADDIAYSTYDLEDAFKAGFTSPLEMLSASDALLEKVAAEVDKALKKNPLSRGKGSKVRLFTSDDVLRVLSGLFSEMIGIDPGQFHGDQEVFRTVTKIFNRSQSFVSSGYARTRLTSHLVGTFIQSVSVKRTPNPVLSQVYLPRRTFEQVEVLKHFTFQNLIMSSRLKVAEHRGYEIVKTIFDKLANDGHLLLPDDCRKLYEEAKSVAAKKRIICDFVAGMTDRYAVEFYGRLKSENAQSIFKPI